MAVDLQYPNVCVACGQRMKPGTQVDFWKEGGDYVFQHGGECPPPPARSQAVTRGLNMGQSKEVALLFQEQECASCGSVWAVKGRSGCVAAFVCDACKREEAA